MPAYRRPSIPGATVFFTVGLADRGSSLLVDEVGRLREAVGAVRAARPFRIDAWVVLPDHLHAVWTLPAGDSEFSVRWGAIKGRFSKALREEGWERRAGFTPPSSHVERNGGVNPALRHHKGEVGLWQRRFWEHHVRDEEDRARCLRYCWANPVRHGLVERAHDWPWSSVHRDVPRGAGWRDP